jgi:hypothetical protein
MELNSVKTAARAVARSVGAFGGYVRTKRCRGCRHLMRKRAIVCMRCGKWQG